MFFAQSLFDNVVKMIQVEYVFGMFFEVMIRIPPIESHINAVLVSIACINNILVFLHHEVRMLISAYKFFFEDYFNVVCLDLIGVDDSIFVDGHICVFQVVSSEHFKEQGASDCSNLA